MRHANLEAQAQRLFVHAHHARNLGLHLADVSAGEYADDRQRPAAEDQAEEELHGFCAAGLEPALAGTYTRPSVIAGVERELSDLSTDASRLWRQILELGS